MKRIFLIRHAKSEQGLGLKDIDRPLNDRGMRDAPKMAIRLSERNFPIDAIVSSPANRAISTARFFAEVFSIPQKAILVQSDLYLPEPAHFYKVIKNLPEKYTSVAIFSHNNGITDFANSLDVARIDHMPTCSIFAFSAQIDSWKDFNFSQKQFIFFDYPKSDQ
ncbi:MAG: SixA phosphatase family protein [Chitinophagaceae bacterium]